MKKRVVQIEIIYDITNIPENQLSSVADAKKIAYLDLQDSLFMEDEGLFDYHISVEDIEE